MTSAFYEWAEIAGTISISRKEERQNAGEGRLLNLLQSKIKQAEMSMREKLNNDLILGTVSGTTFVQDTAEDGSYGLNPLGWFFRLQKATDPTTNDVGNIPADTYSWWQHRTADLGANAGSTMTGEDFALNCTTWKGLKVGLRRLYNYCSRGTGGSPDLAVMDQVSFESYENALDQSVRYMNTKMADMGFDTVKLRGATCIWDESVPDMFTGTAAKNNGRVKSCELLENPNVKVEGNQQPSPRGKVQRLSDYRSTAKRLEAQDNRRVDDIVSSAWRHAAAYKRAA